MSRVVIDLGHMILVWSMELFHAEQPSACGFGGPCVISMMRFVFFFCVNHVWTLPVFRCPFLVDVSRIMSALSVVFCSARDL